jgi:hypothetical protein
MWSLREAAVGGLADAKYSGLELADRILICMHLCPWGLLGSLKNPADAYRQLTELTDQPSSAGWQSSEGRSPAIANMASPIHDNLILNMSSFDASVEPTCRLLYKPLINAESAGCYMDVYTPAKRDASRAYPVAM